MSRSTEAIPREFAERLGIDDSDADNRHRKAAAKMPAPTDDVLRDRFTLRHPDYGYGLGEWRHYADGVWPATSELRVRRDICTVLEDAKVEGVRPSAAKLSSVAELTRVQVAVEDEHWDSDPSILVAANGTIDLTTGELKPHAKEHHATSGVPYAYDPEAHLEAWEERVMGEVVAANLGLDMVGFLQEFAGYSVTTDCSHELAIWLTGKRGGGRSTLIAGMEAMLGPRAGVLSLSDIDRSSFALTNLPGKTLVTATEQPAVFLRGGGVLNAIISGEKVMIDRKYRDPIELIPRCKIIWAMNELPRIASGDDGIFRRVKILEVPEIPAAYRDPAVKEAVKDGGAAILNWAMEGLHRLRKRGGFEVPKTVQDATQEFQQFNDVPAMFVDEECERGLECWESATNLYAAYKQWCIDHGHMPLSSTSAAREWKRLGFSKQRHNKGVRYLGVKIQAAGFTAYHRHDGGRV
jgi:putative DNA primase/helicase